MSHRGVWRWLQAGVGLLAICAMTAIGAAGENAGPKLDETPGAVAPDANLPAPAQWPVLRYERPLRMLAVAGKRQPVTDLQRIARRMRSRIEFRYTGGRDVGMAIYHVNDKWIEPKENPTAEELSAYSIEVVREALRVLPDGRPPADVIFCTMLDDANLLESVKAGAVLVSCGNVYPDEKSPFAAEWPAKPGKRNSWMSGGATRPEIAPEGFGAVLAGLPLERLAGHNWVPIPEATPGSVALSAGESGTVLVRRVGKGVIVFSPNGPISRLHAAIETMGRKYDHDEIWLRLWDQCLYELVQGASAIPAYTDLRPGAESAAPGQEYVLAGKIVNRTAAPQLAVSVHATTPRGQVVFAKEELLDVPAGSEQAYEVRVPVPDEWAAGLYPVYLTVGDPAAKKQLHQSMQFVPVAGSIAMTLTSAKPGYRLGEEARLTLSASSKRPWSGTLSFGIYDFRGRLLHTTSQEATLDETSRSFTFSYQLADHGVRVDALWAQVVARQDGRDWGRAEAKFYKYEPWNMRNEYQWSTWSGIACAPPSLVPRAMRLMAHAGMNALGNPGRNELWYAAERWGWRFYNEGVGVNTWNPRIEYTSDEEIEAQLRKEASGRAVGDRASAAFVLASVNEEGGFGPRGWGATYYWDTPVAPEVACRAFQWFLKTRYGDLSRLNATWRTNYMSWDEIKLTKEFSGAPPKPEADGWARPKESPLGEGVEGVSLAPYADTRAFYGWYYDRIVAAAKKVLREQINPVPLTMASAPSSDIFASRECEVRLAAPGAWNESQFHSLMDGPEPGFALVWGHFDWSIKTDNMFWGMLLARSGHNNYWVDIPLMFNNDLTHTRASFAMRRWTSRFGGHERIILDSRPAPTDVGLLGANGVANDRTRGNMETSLQVALGQGGFGLAGTDIANLEKYKIVFAIGHQAVSKEEAERLARFVENGGTLVFTSRFATQDEFGMPQEISPGHGLAERWGLKVSERTERIPLYHSGAVQTFSLDGVADSLKGHRAATHAIFREKVEHSGWEQLATYDDQVPAILTRAAGRGRLYYINMIYQSHWYIQWVTPTGAERQGFYKLVEWLCEQAGARRTLRLEGDLSQVLHIAVKQFTDPTGDIRYAVVRTSGEVPWVAGKVKWLDKQRATYDVLAPGGPALVGNPLTLNFRPGDGKLLAFVEKPVAALRVDVSPAQITAGEPLKVAVGVAAADGQTIAGSFPLELRVIDAEGNEVAGLARSFSAASGQEIVLNTALNDPSGEWTIRVTDAISGKTGTAAVRVAAAPEAVAAPGFVSWGWPSEIEEPATLAPERFIEQLQALATLYRTPPQRDDDWMNKQRLGYYYEFFPHTRHAILRPLLDLDWPDYAAAIRAAVSGGAELILTGEDLGLDPGTGLSVYPHHDAKQIDAIVAALEGATWSLATADGDTIAATLGSGRVILCRESIDAAGHDNPSAARWQRRFLAELAAVGNAGARIDPPSADRLRRWWIGQEPITPGPRRVTWFGENRRELTLANDAVFTIAVPPAGAIKAASWNLTGDARFDIGCDGTIDADLTAALAQAATTTPHRDDNGWRIIPVRVSVRENSEIKLEGLSIELE